MTPEETLKHQYEEAADRAYSDFFGPLIERTLDIFIEKQIMNSLAVLEVIETFDSPILRERLGAKFRALLKPKE